MAKTKTAYCLSENESFPFFSPKKDSELIHKRTAVKIPGEHCK